MSQVESAMEVATSKRSTSTLSPEPSKVHTRKETLQDAGVLSPDLERSKIFTHIHGRGGSVSQPITR